MNMIIYITIIYLKQTFAIPLSIENKTKQLHKYQYICSKHKNPDKINSYNKLFDTCMFNYDKYFKCVYFKRYSVNILENITL